ncbi:MAG TPA: arylesterase [Pyrinomonadaceae bacterium]|nr:arylesterase [Pyrinomonadaceae bacterium]
MRDVFRIIAVISFSFFAFVSLGCSNFPAANTGTASQRKPLATPVSKSDRPKIVAFGDSLTAGFGLLEKESYPYLLQERLKTDGHDFEVVNAGVSGDTTLGGLDRIDWVLEMENLQILILELGANDMMRNVPVDKIRSNLETIIKKAKAKNVRVLLCGMVAPPTMGLDYARDFMAVFFRLAKEHELEYLPFLLEGVALKKELNQADGIHPNPEGTRLMTENV